MTIMLWATGGRELVTSKSLVRHLADCATQVDMLKSLRSENHTPPPIIIGLTEVNPHRSHKNSIKFWCPNNSANIFASVTSLMQC